MNGLSEKDIMVDLLNDTKFASDCYHAAILEAANDNVWNTFLRLHNDELTGARLIFNLMHQRGWYPLQPATPATGPYQQPAMQGTTYQPTQQAHGTPAYQPQTGGQMGPF